MGMGCADLEGEDFKANYADDEEGEYFVKAYEVLNNYVKRGKRQDIIGWMPKHEALVIELDELSEFVLDRNNISLFEITEKDL